MRNGTHLMPCWRYSFDEGVVSTDSRIFPARSRTGPSARTSSWLVTPSFFQRGIVCSTSATRRGTSCFFPGSKPPTISSQPCADLHGRSSARRAGKQQHQHKYDLSSASTIRRPLWTARTSMTPIVLQHGLFGFGEFQRRVVQARILPRHRPRDRRTRATRVIISRVHPTGSIARRARRSSSRTSCASSRSWAARRIAS